MNVRNYTRAEENYSFCNCFWSCYSSQLFLQLFMLKFCGFGESEIYQFILWRKGKILQDKLEVGSKETMQNKSNILLRHIWRFWSWFATNINNLADTEKSYYGGTFFKCHMDKRKLWKLFSFHPSHKCNIFFSYNGLHLYQVLSLSDFHYLLNVFFIKVKYTSFLWSLCQEGFPQKIWKAVCTNSWLSISFCLFLSISSILPCFYVDIFGILCHYSNPGAAFYKYPHILHSRIW